MSSDESTTDKECPLCMEPFDFDDLNFYPCTCQYQICRFCWHRLRTDENGLCPACRQPYPENPVNYQPVSGSELQKIKSKSKMANKSGKVKSTDGRKHLVNYRVLQKNLVYVVGLSQKLAEPEVLKKPEFFGKFGRILKVVVGSAPILNNAGQQASCTAYVTYARDDDALRAIEAVNNAVLDGRLLKASLGTTKYCSTFLRGQTCHKAIGGKMDCMYLHKIADPEQSFTREDMQAGKHTEFERKLHEELETRATAASQKRRAASGSVEKTDAKKSNNELSGEAETNMSDAGTNSSEQENSNSIELEMDEPTLVVEQQQIKTDNVLKSLQNTDNIPAFSSPSTVSIEPVVKSESLMFSQTPSPPIQPNAASTASSTNKFTTCEEFERMLIMESKGSDDTSTTNNNQQHSNGNSHKPNLNFDDDLGFDPFSESIKGLADLVIEEQESRKQQQQEQQKQQSAISQANLNFLFNRFPQMSQLQPQTLPTPIQRPIPSNPASLTQTEPLRLYNSYLHQNTYMRYTQFRDYAKSALNASAFPGPPPGLHAAMGSTTTAGNGFFSQK